MFMWRTARVRCGRCGSHQRHRRSRSGACPCRSVSRWWPGSVEGLDEIARQIHASARLIGGGSGRPRREYVADEDPLLLRQMLRRGHPRLGVDRRVIVGLAGVGRPCCGPCSTAPRWRCGPRPADTPDCWAVPRPSADGIAPSPPSAVRRARTADDSSVPTSELQQVRCCDDRWNPPLG